MKSLITASLLISAAILLNAQKVNAQVGIGTTSPHASAALEINSTNKGILVPRMTEANRPSSPATGLLIYQTDNTPGFYVYNGSAWTAVSGSGSGSAQAGFTLTTRSNSTWASGNPGAVGPYFFSPVPVQTSANILDPANTAAATGNGTNLRTGFVVPANCTFKKIKLGVRIIAGGVDNGQNKTTTITLYKNGFATGLTVQVTTGSAVGASGSAMTAVDVPAVGGDIISLEYTQINQEPNATFSVLLEGQ